MKQFEVTPIFPTIIGSFFLEDGMENHYKKIVENNSFKQTSFGGGCQVSLRYDVLDEFKIIKEQIESGFTEFKNSVLRLEDTQFKMTTSWVTRTPPNCGSQRHSHKNSYYSGVLYLTDHSDQSPILLYNPNDNNTNILTNPAKEYTVLNSKTWTIHPEKNKVILFPSYIDHMILRNVSSDDRYSIAFNFFPSGKIGTDDSQIEFVL